MFHFHVYFRSICQFLQTPAEITNATEQCVERIDPNNSEFSSYGDDSHFVYLSL